MITTRRSSGYEGYSEISSRGGTDVLERPRTSFAENTAPETEMSEAAVRENMQRNLDRLMNYDRYSEIQAEEAAIKTEEPVRETVVKETVKPAVVAVSDDDIRPTSTTMQFGDGDTSKVYNDLERSKEAHGSYRLNGKGKLVVALYALVVTVILALIVLNTGVLKTLDREIAELDSVRAAAMQKVAEQTAEIEYISSDAYIIEKAEDLGMIIK